MENERKDASVQNIVTSMDRAFILYSDMHLTCWSLEDGSLTRECSVTSSLTGERVMTYIVTC